MRIQLEPADQSDVVALVDALDAYQKPLYPPESHHGIDIAALCRPEVRFAVVRDARGVAVGCGAVVLDPPRGELKRMYVDPAFRGRGIGRVLLGFLEQAAVEGGCLQLLLETGTLQPEAIALYEAAGFVRCGPFGDYVDDPHSLFFCKAATP
jgi:putative acetyltransferase